MIILGMALVTYIPRFLPVFVIEWMKVPDWANRWLKSVPYAALGALIFPGILSIEKESSLIGLMGGAVAVIFAYLRLNIIYVVFGSIIAVVIARSLLL